MRVPNKPSTFLWLLATVMCAIAFALQAHGIKWGFFGFVGIWFFAGLLAVAAFYLWIEDRTANTAKRAATVVALMSVALLSYVVPALIEGAPVATPKAFTDTFPALVFADRVKFAPDGVGLRVIFPDVHVANTSDTNMVAVVRLFYQLTPAGSAASISVDSDVSATAQWLQKNGFGVRAPLTHPLSLGPRSVGRGFLAFRADPSFMDTLKWFRIPTPDEERLSVVIENSLTGNWLSIAYTKAAPRFPGRIDALQ